LVVQFGCFTKTPNLGAMCKLIEQTKILIQTLLDGIVFGKNTHWPIGDWKFRNVKELGLEPGILIN
jgi:hypothetical protein